jgi:ankyrin repeat protein
MSTVLGQVNFIQNPDRSSNLGRFEGVPPEVLVNILAFLSPEELSKIAEVSRYLKNISNDLELWKPVGEKFHITSIDKSNPKLQVTAEIVQRKLNGKLFEDICENPFKLENALKDNPNLLSLVDLEGNTLAHRIVRIGRYQEPEVVRTVILFLMATDADVMIKNVHGQTPLDKLFAEAQFHQIHNTAIPMVIEWIVYKKIDFNNVRNSFGQTFLHLLTASNVPYENVAHFFVQTRWLHVDVNVKDNFGLTPLAYATIGGNRKCARMLIAKGATYNFVENADIYAWNKEELNRTALKNNAELKGDVIFNEILGFENQVENAQELDGILVENYITALQKISNAGKKICNRMLNKLIEKIKNEHINKQNKDGYSLAHIAALMDNAKGLELLHKKRANFELLQKDGLTPLGLSIRNSRENSFFKLVEQDAQIPDKMVDGKLTLHLCLYCKSIKIIDYCFKNQNLYIPLDMENVFIQNGINTDDYTIEEKMMRLADRVGNSAMVLYLMKKGLRPEISVPE